MARVVLVGLPGVGKTTVADALAAAWGIDAIDADAFFLATTGRSVQDHIRHLGEVSFREAECEALRAMTTMDAVIATGGGIVTTAPARGVLEHECTIWLDAPNDVLLERVATGDRPLLGDDPAEALVRLRAQREALYREVATITIDASAAVAEIVHDIVSTLEARA